MASKTISVDIEAYEVLRRRKGPGQSFSDVIKEHFRGDETGATLLRAAREAAVSDETLDGIDRIISERTRSAPRAAALE